jgi:hypothetical protein
MKFGIIGAVRRGTRHLIALAAAMTASLLWASASFAAISVDNFDVQAANESAGANSDLAIGFDLGGDSTAKDMVIHLPPGLVGNPLATPTCSEEQLNSQSCPPASVVGALSNEVEADGIPLPLQASGEVYNVQPRPGEPARFGFILRASPELTAPIILQSPASLRPGDFGLDTTLNDLPNQAQILGVLGVDIQILNVQLDLNGQANGQGFLRNPTSCGTNTFSVDVTAYDGTTASGSDSFDTSNCEAIPFSPEFSANVVQAAGPLTQAAEVSTTISQTIEEAGLKRAQVTLPGDLAGNQAALATQCPAPDFEAGNCPANTRVGDAVAVSPLQSQPLQGGVFVVSSGGVLPNLGLDLRGPLSLKLTGAISLTPDLRSQVTFDGLPDIPISEFTLSFAGGESGLSVPRRNLCSGPDSIFDTSFLAHSGATLDAATPAKVTCEKAPVGKAKLKVPKRGEPKLKLKLKQGTDRIREVKAKVPAELRFASGKTLKRGSDARADGKRIKAKAKGRTLKLKAKRKGAKKVKATFTDGAIKVGKGKITDAIQVTVREADKDRIKILVPIK